MITKNDIKFWGPKYGSIYPYLECSTPYHNLIDSIFDFLTFNVNDNILDCGAGSGLIVKKILENEKHVANIDALDVSEVMLSHIKDKLKDIDDTLEDKVNLVLHDLSYKLKVEDEKYDKIISNLVLTYNTTHEGEFGEEALEGVLSDMYRVLKVNGSFVWSTPIKDVSFLKVFIASGKDMLDLKNYKRLYYGPMILKHALEIQRKGKEGLYHFYEKDKIESILLRIGFKNIKFKKTFADQAWVVSCKK